MGVSPVRNVFGMYNTEYIPWDPTIHPTKPWKVTYHSLAADGKCEKKNHGLIHLPRYSSGEVALTCIWVSPIVCACYKRHTRAPNPAGPDGGGLIRAIYTKFDRLKCVPEMSDESAKREKNQKTGLVKQMLDERWKKQINSLSRTAMHQWHGSAQLLLGRWKKQNNWIMSDPIMQSRLVLLE